jgi:hypothetical protein
MPTEPQTSEALVRIRVPLEPAPGDAPDEDRLWAEPLGSGRFRIESSPFFAYGISRDDVVQALPIAGGEGEQRLEDVLEKGGHRTLRVALDPSVELTSGTIQGLLERLLELGCTHESLRPKLVALDVPGEVDVEVVAQLLQTLADEGTILWEWADPRPS